MIKKAITLIMMLVACAAQAARQEQGYVVTSDRMEAKKNGKVAVFTGNVKLDRDKLTMTADKVESYEDRDLLIVSGSVHGVDTSEEDEVLEVFCEEAKYDRSLSTGVLTGNPRVISKNLKDETKSVDISGDRIEVFEGEKVGKVEGNVVVLQEDIRAESDLLDYRSEKRQIILTKGNPVIYQKNEDIDAEYSAYKITMFVEEKRIVFEDAFKAIIHMKD